MAMNLCLRLDAKGGGYVPLAPFLEALVANATF
jgi:hypothetical protein